MAAGWQKSSLRVNLSAQNFQIMQPITSSQFKIIHFDWLHLGLNAHSYAKLQILQRKSEGSAIMPTMPLRRPSLNLVKSKVKLKF